MEQNQVSNNFANGSDVTSCLLALYTKTSAESSLQVGIVSILLVHIKFMVEHISFLHVTPFSFAKLCTARGIVLFSRDKVQLERRDVLVSMEIAPKLKLETYAPIHVEFTIVYECQNWNWFQC